jgi:hypothetical protein
MLGATGLGEVETVSQRQLVGERGGGSLKKCRAPISLHSTACLQEGPNRGQPDLLLNTVGFYLIIIVQILIN